MRIEKTIAVLILAIGTVEAQQPTREDIERQIQALRQLQMQTPSPLSPVTAPAQAAAPAPGPKKEGVKRIGVPMPRAQMGQGTGVTDFGEPIRQALAQYLAGPTVEVIPLNARVPLQVLMESQQKECDYVLDASVVTSKSGGGLGKFAGMARAAQPMIGMIPLAGIAGTAGSVISATATVAASATIATLGSLAGTIKQKDEVTFEYKLIGSDKTVLVADTSKRTAKRDGEDVLTPLVEQVSTVVTQKILTP